MTTFADLGLGAKVLDAVTKAGYSEPTPVQEQAIPQILRGRDILGCAQTGTGKTASFVLPMIEILESGRARARMPRSLILEPTRELAYQVAEHFTRYGCNHGLTSVLLIGGVPMDEQARKLDRGVDVLIATPGRLMDHIERGNIILSGVKICVLDESDRMLDMGFIGDIEAIMRMLPSIRQTLMFSATMAPTIRKLAGSFMLHHKVIEAAPPASVAKTLVQHLVPCTGREKNKLLVRLLSKEPVDKCLIFLNRKREIGALLRVLTKEGLAVDALHGDMDQYKRFECLERFRSGATSVLICSDVAARGLDIPKVSHVFNYDVPGHPEDYVHRIGRAGRAGRPGVAITLGTAEDREVISSIEALMGESISIYGQETSGQETSGQETSGPKASQDSGPETRAAPSSDTPASEKAAKPRPGRAGSSPPAEGDAFGSSADVPAFLTRSPFGA